MDLRHVSIESLTEYGNSGCNGDNSDDPIGRWEHVCRLLEVQWELICRLRAMDAVRASCPDTATRNATTAAIAAYREELDAAAENNQEPQP